jgi:hypothetical protein
MSFKVSKIVVGKGKTTTDEKQTQWTRQYYEAEVIIEDEHQIELAKESVEALLDTWLSGKSITQEEKKPIWNPDKIKWVQAEGTSGTYERSEDVDNLEFKAMLKDLAEHQGKFQREGYFYWAFQKASVVGRKKKVK